MSSKGRGRGRGHSAGQTGRPGGGSTKDPVEDLEMLVKGLSLVVEARELASLQNVAMKACTTEESRNKVFESLYRKCQEDWRFSPCAASILSELVTTALEDNGKEFRNQILKCIHSEYTNKDKLRTESPQKFLGLVSILCQLYIRLLDPTGKPFDQLTKCVMELLEMLLDDKATDEEMFCAAEQFFAIGKTLQECVDKIRLTSLRNKVQDKIIHAIGSKDVRRELIRVVEGFASEWKHSRTETIRNK